MSERSGTARQAGKARRNPDVKEPTVPFRVGWIDDRELDVRAIVLQDRALDESLEVQRSEQDTEQDRALAQDRYCLVRNGAATSYGGVEAFSLSGSVLTLTLTLT
jgi:hypothetical protein